MQIARFLENVVDWAESDGEVLSVGLIGSHARAEARPGSDVDLIVLCKAVDSLAAIDPAVGYGWLERFGGVHRAQLERYGIVRSWRAFYDGGLEVEFGLGPEEWAPPLGSAWHLFEFAGRGRL